jgi:predicted nucleotidyltransferase component of viral defense system
MIKPAEIKQFAHLSGVRDIQIEKDYILTWILYGISKHEQLSEVLAFKGGTVEKKCTSKIIAIQKISILPC